MPAADADVCAALSPSSSAAEFVFNIMTDHKGEKHNATREDQDSGLGPSLLLSER